ncbi:hypothetical protein LTR08_007797 [Meristemomyces frigidus]|nr:hypothetical protein LTR08_007797 [Meristemomyces frigidus]
MESTGKRKRGVYRDDEEEKALFVTPASDDRNYADADTNADAGGVKSEGEGDLNDTSELATVESDEDGEHSAYNEQFEPLPRCAAYDPRFEKLQQRLISLASNARAVLDGQMCDTEAFTRLQALANDAASIPEARREMIGFLGDTGAGKSSFTNSFTDIPNMAKALDAGQSCTYCVTVYTKASPDQKENFSAEIEYFDLETIGRLLSGSLDDWQVWRFECDPTWTEDLKQQYRRRAMTCLSTFRAVFRTMSYFETNGQAEQRLDDIVRKKLEREDEVQMFVSNAKKELDRKPQHNNKYYDYWEADTQEELRDITDPLLSEVSDYDEPTLWPLVKKVKWGVRGSRILDNFDIADLPGISDTNQVRVNATFEHIDLCNHVWCVSRAGRIVSDLVVDGLLGRYGVPFDGNVAVIATKSDENISHELALDMRRRGYDLGDYDQLRNTVQKANRNLKNLTTRKNKLPAYRGQEKPRLQEQIEAQRETSRELENMIFGLVIQARNTHIVESLRREKQQHLPQDKKLHAFAVSNLHYAAHKEVAEVAGSLLSPDLTGIPGVRAFALSIAAPRIFRGLEDFVNQRFSLFIRGLELWANQKLAQGRDELVKMVKEPQGTVNSVLLTYTQSLQVWTEQSLIAPFGDHQAGFVTHAMQYIDELHGWHWVTLRSFVKNYGNHSTSVKPQTSWNEIFFHPALTIIKAGWVGFRKAHTALVADMETSIIKQVREISTNLKKNASAITLSQDAFEQALQANIDGLHIAFRAHIKAMSQGFRNILLRATTDQGESYFRATLTQAYEICQDDKGKGVKERTLTCFRTHLSLHADSSPFAILAVRIQSAIMSLADEQAVVLRAEIRRILGNIVTTFDLMISREEFDPLEVPARDAIKEFLVKGKSMFEAIRADLARLKGEYKSDRRLLLSSQAEGAR